MVVNELIEKKLSELADEQREEQKCLQKFIEKARADLEAKMGDAYAELRAYITESIKLKSGEVIWEIIADQLELAPIEVTTNSIIVWGQRSFNNFEAALVDARLRYPKYQERRQLKQIECLRRQLNVCNDAQIEDIYSQLCSIAPEKIEDWNRLRSNRIEEQMRRKQAEIEQQRINVLREIYKREFRDYYKKHLQILEANGRKTAMLQRELDELTYKIWTLMYNDGSGSVRECFVLKPRQSFSGFWQVVRYGSVEPTKIFMPVELIGPQNVRVGDSYHTTMQRRYLENAGNFCIMAPPGFDLDKAIDKLQWEPLPEGPPQPPDGLDEWNIGNIDWEVRSELGG